MTFDESPPGEVPRPAPDERPAAGAPRPPSSEPTGAPESAPVGEPVAASAVRPPHFEASADAATPRASGERRPRHRLERRMARIREEIERNRRGEAAVPTWVLALILVVLVGGMTALIVLS